MSETPQYLGRMAPVFVVGDSNSIIYNGMAFRHPERPTLTFVFRTTFFHECSLLELSEAGAPSPLLRNALRQALVISADHGWTVQRRWPTRGEGYEVLNDRVTGTTESDEFCVLLVVTHRDFVRALMRLGPGSDFTLPDVLHGPTPVESVGTVYPVPLALVEELLAPSFVALSDALRPMTDGGFHHVYVLGLRPPSLDDVALEQRWQLPSRAPLRYKLTMLINERLRETCERIGARYIDPWPMMTIDGIFDPRLELDHVHFNADAARRVASHLIDDYVVAHRNDESS